MSDFLKQYKIQHAGLKKEIHEFTFELDDKFFANFENSLIEQSNITASVSFDKRQLPYIIELDIDGIINSECDKCTANIPVSIHATYKLYVKYTTEEALIESDDVEIIYISKEDQEIDFSHILYEYAHLSIPIHKICDQPGETEYCDLEIIRLIEEQAIQTELKTDQRWSGLDKLRDKLN